MGATCNGDRGDSQRPINCGHDARHYRSVLGGKIRSEILVGFLCLLVPERMS